MKINSLLNIHTYVVLSYNTLLFYGQVAMYSYAAMFVIVDVLFL